MIKVLNSENFDSVVLQSKKPVLVDFFASWCGPCKMLAPTIEQLSDEPISKKTDFAKLDIDSSIEIAQQYSVMSVPTMILFKDGKEQFRMVGVQPKDAITGAIMDYTN